MLCIFSLLVLETWMKILCVGFIVLMISTEWVELSRMNWKRSFSEFTNPSRTFGDIVWGSISSVNTVFIAVFSPKCSNLVLSKYWWTNEWPGIWEVCSETLDEYSRPKREVWEMFLSWVITVLSHNRGMWWWKVSGSVLGENWRCLAWRRDDLGELWKVFIFFFFFF